MRKDGQPHVKEKSNLRTAFVVRLRAEGKTYKEISNTLGISIGRVRQLVARAEWRQREAKETNIYDDWRVRFDFTILLPMINQIKGLAKK